MFHADSSGFPVFWWLWWFIVAFFAYGGLAVWFWRAGRKHDSRTPLPDVEESLEK